ncbi:hypothetical protein F503_05026 [Ophiostoma piceae UAMH 11346]|uniref:Meiotically up-regulated gene 154 protein n=1 Tax=Ophiostoma piceae (strain UAMH 11346) TaxID=1262450 RepID=S3CD41_OPHP1|nr:hypothetical protein F503_05026 [Ophiostoma piceae UAMH 11346]
MPRLVRRQTLFQRISAAINPWDFLLWLSEEIETRELDSSSVGTQVGLVANFLFLLARANLGPSNTADDDVFGDGSGPGWISYLIQLLVWAGFSLSIVNALFVFTRKRHYRLFEANIETRPGGTPSASRVRVQSSPTINSFSPLRLLNLNDLVGADSSAESRAHPDSTRDVWELAVWDPRPAALALLSYFSPLHILVYMFELPLDPLEPRPSVAVFKCLVLQVGLSATMHLLQQKNDQRQRDNAIVQKEVLHEYDTKFVQPRLHPVVRDMGTQVSMEDAGVGPDTSPAPGSVSGSVEFGTPTTLIRRSFQTHPNANYVKHVDPDFVPRGSSTHSTSMSTGTSYNYSSNNNPRVAATPRAPTPATQPLRYSDTFTPAHSNNSWARQSMPSGPAVAATPIAPLATVAGTPATAASSKQPPSALPSSKTTNFGGSMGVYSHVNSPLKKAISMNDIGSRGFASPRNSREMAAVEQREAAERMQRRGATPAKEHVSRVPHPQQTHQTSQAQSQQPAPGTDSRLSFRPDDLSSPPVPFNPFAKSRPNAQKYERFPSRW